MSAPGRAWSANRFGWDWRAKAHELGPPPAPIIDSHTHIHGREASKLYDEVRKLFGVELTYTMSQLPRAAEVRDYFGPSMRFIAMPTFGHSDRNAAHRREYLRTIESFHKDYGARMMKIWSSPRLREIVPDGACDLQDIDSPWRREHAKLAQSLGMMIMVHVADPDTWYAKKYNDSHTYGTKRHAYVGLERMLDEFTCPWIAAHMGGWPEDLDFLDGMLTRHPNLHLDTSATKWIVREISKHPKPRVVQFFTKWSGRIIFGTDLVTMDDQLSTSKSLGSAMGDLASSPQEAFELYCSRHWALRAMFETNYDGESPIADGDLKMIDPSAHNDMSAPRLQGFGLSKDLLRVLYHGASDSVIGKWWREHP
jgi:hypothetical protein